MLLLAIESTCDETAAAVISDKLDVLSSVVSSQDKLHQRFGGIVPEIAARAHVERILPVVHDALARAGVGVEAIDAIAVAHMPGLAGSILVGLSAAKALSLALGKPLVAVNHLHAHVFACRMAAGTEIYPCLGLVVSGGHTSLFRCSGPLEMELLGGTIDDAAGETFDKVASLLGLGFPGGPAIQRTAEGGNPRAYDFPRSFLHEPRRMEFSFSGLKTAVRYAIAGAGEDLPAACQRLSPTEKSDLAASFQEAVVDVLVGKTLQAVALTGLTTVCVGGGVAANRSFRERLTEAAAREGLRLFIAPMAWCTDNAAMGAIAMESIRAGRFASLDLDAQPGLIRPGDRGTTAR